MSLIGNNNNKPGTEALKREADGRGWLSGNMAQIMVLLNGLILTFTAYFTLSVFMNQIVDDNLSALTYETREHLNDRFGNLEKSILNASQIVSFSWKLDTNDILNNFSQAFTYGGYYDQLFWLESTGNGQYLVHTLFKNPSKFRDMNFTKVHKYVISSLHNTKSEINVLSDYAGYAPELQQLQANKPLLLARAFPRDGRMDIVYGVSGINRILSPEFFGNRKSIQELSVEFSDGNQSLYNYMRFDLPEGGRDLENSVKKHFDIMLGDKMLRLDIWVALGEHEQFLKKIPFLMLLFGATLTMIGTMYVRNNQKQSLRLATVNLELGQKNTDLNREVEEREKLNETLRRQEKENRAVIDAVSDIIFETSTDGNILFLNETWQKITGFSAERSLGRNLFDLLHMQDQAEQRSNFSLLVKGKKTAYRAFTRLRTAEGTFRAIELAFSMIRQDENKDLRVVGTITDVEERRRAERALSEAEKKYRAIVENAAAGIYQVTPEGHYLSANPAMAQILGFGSADEILRDVRNANTDVYYNGRERERHLRDAVRNGSINTEAQVRRKDGRLIWVQESLRAVKDDDDQLIFFEGSMEDITQRKETEIALREAKVGSDLANRAKSEFLANMSHELRTPLNAIIGFSEIIRTQAFGTVGSPEYLDYARDINESGKRLLQVINDILDVSRIEAGERQLNEGVVDLHKILVSSLEMLAPKIEANRMVLSNHVRDTVPKLIGESHAIKQMLINLLSNAVKFTPEGGRISIDADVDDYGQMHVSVTDTGIGLSDEEIEKALSPFGQVDSSLNKSESGTGLGLTLVQSLMALHGGSFELFSQKGIGTTATLVFPPKRVSHQGVQQPVDA
ncbi:MAG TPA: PAS domain S-box protein [Micavibrio sp.]|nr:PAS domain S-box protein [Micavibrio sp.]